MQKFNVGDKVICIDAESFTGLKTGEMYTIKEIHKYYIGLKEITGSYFGFRFELVSRKSFLEKSGKDLRRFLKGE